MIHPSKHLEGASVKSNQYRKFSTISPGLSVRDEQLHQRAKNFFKRESNIRERRAARRDIANELSQMSCT